MATVLSMAFAIGAILVVLPGRGASGSHLQPRAAASGTADDPRNQKVRSAEALHLVAAVGAATAVLLVLPSAPGAALAVGVGAAVWWRSRSWESAAVRRRRRRLEAELPHVVDLMTAALAAGSAPTTALALVVEVVDPAMADELRTWTTRLELGADPVGAWRSMARHPPLARLGLTLQRSAESGAPVAEALRRLSEDLRDRRRAEVEERVRQVEVRAAVPLGVCLLPSFVLVGVVPLIAGSVNGLLVR
jgi:Flp pilus assembly protein TadB